MSFEAGVMMFSGGAMVKKGYVLKANRCLFLLTFILLLLPLVARAGDGNSVSLKATAAEGVVLSKAAQQRLASKLFNDIYKIGGGRGAAEAAKKIVLYQQIIKQCPDVPLAQESYWHLLETMMLDVQPPQKEEALRLYADFNRRYPQSKMRVVVSHQVLKGLYRLGQWAELDRLASQYLETVVNKKNGAPSSPLALFWRTEARYRLGKIAAAKEGYDKILHYFPKSLMARVARERLAANAKKVKAEN